MITLTITDETIQEAFDTAVKKLLMDNNSYNNPITDIVKKVVGTTYTKGALTEQIEAKITSKLEAFMETTEFDAMLGQAVAKAIADREVAKEKRK